MISSAAGDGPRRTADGTTGLGPAGGGAGGVRRQHPSASTTAGGGKSFPPLGGGGGGTHCHGAGRVAGEDLDLRLFTAYARGLMAAVTPPRRISPLSGLGPALRRLRMRRGQRQFETAEAAAITKAMLSAYENGKRRPSLKTLDQILAALEADLGDLHAALTLERRERARAAHAVEESREGEAAHPALPNAGPDELAEPPPRYGDEAPPADAWPELAWRRSPEADLYHALGLRGPLPPTEERALSEMLVGFLKLLRYLHAGGEDAAGGAPRRPYSL